MADSDLMDIQEALKKHSPKCACVCMEDGQSIDINCSCRCRTGSSDIKDPWSG